MGVLFRGERPTLDLRTAITFGAAGLAGAGGAEDNDGVDGVARAILELPEAELTDP